MNYSATSSNLGIRIEFRKFHEKGILKCIVFLGMCIHVCFCLGVCKTALAQRVSRQIWVQALPPEHTTEGILKYVREFGMISFSKHS